MEKEHDLFLTVLTELHKAGALKNIILIGGWCPILYRVYFNDPMRIPALRTTDIDFLIPNPPKIKNEVDVDKILTNLGFDRITDYYTGYTKFANPQLEVEFLTPELSKGKNKPYQIKKLHINAQGLRYLNLLQNYIIEVSYNQITVKVPEPAAFVLHKFLFSQFRKKEAKKEKDLTLATQLGNYLLQVEPQKQRMIQIFSEIPKKWQKKILSNITIKELSEILTSK